MLFLAGKTNERVLSRTLNRNQQINAMADGGDAAPSRGQMRRDAKRSMYAYSSEKAVKMGVKSQVGKSREAAKYNAADKVGSAWFVTALLI